MDFLKYVGLPFRRGTCGKLVEETFSGIRPMESIEDPDVQLRIKRRILLIVIAAAAICAVLIGFVLDPYNYMSLLPVASVIVIAVVLILAACCSQGCLPNVVLNSGVSLGRWLDGLTLIVTGAFIPLIRSVFKVGGEWVPGGMLLSALAILIVLNVLYVLFFLVMRGAYRSWKKTR